MPNYDGMSTEDLHREVERKAKGLASAITGGSGASNSQKGESPPKERSMDAKKVIENALGGDAAKAGAVYDALKGAGLLKEEKPGEEDPSEEKGDESKPPPFGKDSKGGDKGGAGGDKGGQKDESYDDLLGGLKNMGPM